MSTGRPVANRRRRGIAAAGRGFPTREEDQKNARRANGMGTRQLTGDDFEQATHEGAVLVDFWAEWCGPCRHYAPTYERASERHPEVVFAKVNVDEHPELAARYGIRSIPTTVALRDGEVVASRSAVLAESALDDLVASVTGDVPRVA
jgi:thioredoxin 1